MHNYYAYDGEKKKGPLSSDQRDGRTSEILQAQHKIYSRLRILVRQQVYNTSRDCFGSPQLQLAWRILPPTIRFLLTTF